MEESVVRNPRLAFARQRSNRGLGLGLDRDRAELSSLLTGKQSLTANDVAAVRAMMIREKNRVEAERQSKAALEAEEQRQQAATAAAKKKTVHSKRNGNI